LIVVDGRTAYVSGLCIGQDWVGRPEKHKDPWRDTGVEIVGPAAAHAEQAFAETWRFAGSALPETEVVDPETVSPAGEVSLRLIPTEPFTWSMLQLDLLVTSLAKRTLWITDAYFLG